MRHLAELDIEVEEEVDGLAGLHVFFFQCLEVSDALLWFCQLYEVAAKPGLGC